MTFLSGGGDKVELLISILMAGTLYSELTATHYCDYKPFFFNVLIVDMSRIRQDIWGERARE